MDNLPTWYYIFYGKYSEYCTVFNDQMCTNITNVNLEF